MSHVYHTPTGRKTVRASIYPISAEPYYNSRKDDDLWRAFVHQNLPDLPVEDNEEQEQLKKKRYFVNSENESFQIYNDYHVLDDDFITILVQGTSFCAHVV